MSHTFLSLKTNLIPQETKDNLPEYGSCLFSNDADKNNGEPSRILIDGYNDLNELVMNDETVSNWLQWSKNPSAIIAVMMHPDNVINYTKEQIKLEKKNVNSVWYIPESVED